jgi:hypothetical protein
MKRILFFLLILTVILPFKSAAQTAGTMSFTVTTTTSGGFSPKHLVAIWIESGSGAFVKTLLKRSSNGNLDHLSQWTSSSGGNVTDAVTGATLTSNGTLSVSWDGTDIHGNLVPDGTYELWIEMAWAQSMMTGKTWQTYNFTKGPDPFQLIPDNTLNFSDMNLTWSPQVSSAEETAPDSEIRVFPNPATDRLNIAFPEQPGQTTISLINLSGAVVYQNSFVGGKSAQAIDLKGFTPGIYFLRIEQPGRQNSIKVMVN